MEFKTIAIVAIFIAATTAIEEANSNDLELQKKLVDLQHRHVDWLLDHPDVTGVDVNRKSVGGKQTDQLSLVVWVREKLPENEVPEERRLPREIEGFPVDVIEGEEAVGLNTEDSWRVNSTYPTPTESTPTESTPTMSKSNESTSTAQTPTPTLTLTPTPTPTPAPDCPCRDDVRGLRGGHCIKIKNCPGFGTLGYFTKPRRNGELGILSNFHVTEGPPNRITSKPDQPLDDDDYVATVDTVSFNKFVDASHSELCGNELPIPALKDGTVVKGIQRETKCWDSVRFCGCTSDCVNPGKVFSTDFCTKVTVRLKGEVLQKKFCNQIVFTPVPMPGDSGSLLINTATNKTVGLVFAGNSIYGFANPIKTVLNNLGVTLA